MSSPLRRARSRRVRHTPHSKALATVEVYTYTRADPRAQRRIGSQSAIGIRSRQRFDSIAHDAGTSPARNASEYACTSRRSARRRRAAPKPAGGRPETGAHFRRQIAALPAATRTLLLVMAAQQPDTHLLEPWASATSTRRNAWP